MINEGNQLIHEQDDYNLKDILLKCKLFLDFLKLHFWKLLIIGILGGGLGFFYAFTSDPIYSAKVRFLMKESGSGSALMSSLGSLGSLIGGAAGTASPMDRTLAIIGSERIVGAALFKTIVIDNQSDLAINHFIRIQELHKAWKKDTLLNKILFLKTNVNPDAFDFRYRKAFRSILNMFVVEKSTILTRSFEKKSGVFDLSINTKSEGFSIEFSKLLYKELEQFIYNQSVATSGKNVAVLTNKIDSIRAELNAVQNALARNTDRTLGLLMQEDRVDQKKMMMKEQMLTIMYGEAQKNLETFRFLNESTVVGLEVIASPFSPIKPTQKSIIKFTIFGFLFFGFMGLSFIYIRKWLKENPIS